MEKMEGKATAEQIQEWKKKHGDVFQVQGDNKVGYIRVPKRAEVSMAMSYAPTNPLKMTEVILQSCWLDGSSELRDNDKYFYGLNAQINEIIEMAEVQVKKL